MKLRRIWNEECNFGWDAFLFVMALMGLIGIYLGIVFTVIYLMQQAITAFIGG